MAGLIYGLDRAVAYFFSEQTLAPVLAILGLAGLVFLGSPRLILLAIPLFAAESYWIIRDSSMDPHIRTISVVLGGLLAYWANLEKNPWRPACPNWTSSLQNCRPRGSLATAPATSAG